MHIAIGLWGLVRTLRFIVPSFKLHCIEPLINAGHTYEVFVHTFVINGTYKNARNQEGPTILDMSHWDLVSPDHITTEKQSVFDREVNYVKYQTKGDPWQNNYDSFKNNMRAMYLQQQLTLDIENRAQKVHFDGIIFLRPDVKYVSDIPFYLLQEFPNTLFVPDFHRDCVKDYNYNDRMAMGNMRNALAYGKRFGSAYEYSKKYNLHAERFTYWFLNKTKIHTVEMPFRFQRIRSGGLMNWWDRTLAAPSMLNDTDIEDIFHMIPKYKQQLQLMPAINVTVTQAKNQTVVNNMLKQANKTEIKSTSVVVKTKVKPKRLLRVEPQKRLLLTVENVSNTIHSLIGKKNGSCVPMPNEYISEEQYEYYRLKYCYILKP